MSAIPAFLRPEQCCLLVVDPQEKLMTHIHESDRVVRNIGLLVELAAVMDLSILATTQYQKGIGPFVPALAGKLEQVECLDKTEFGALSNREIRNRLEQLPPAIDTLVLCGVESHICIYQTALGALQQGYKVWVVADAVSSRTRENDRFGRRRMATLGAVLAPTEMIIYELLQKAGTPSFKAMLPSLK